MDNLNAFLYAALSAGRVYSSKSRAKISWTARTSISYSLASARKLQVAGSLTRRRTISLFLSTFSGRAMYFFILAVKWRPRERDRVEVRVFR